MPVLHCPTCGSKLDIYKGGGIWSVKCHRCDVSMMVNGRGNDLFDAYDAYIEAVKRGTLTPSSSAVSKPTASPDRDTSSRRRRSSGAGDRVESEKLIRKTIEEGGLSVDSMPEAIRNMVLRGRDYLVSYRHFPATDAEYGINLDDLKLPKRLINTLRSKGIKQLYRFQEQAFKSISDGKDVIIAAPTAQGKTEAFVLPIIRNILLSIEDSV
ncbi:MAG: DEAD/DEAH box helicase, partial [Candidatus Thorarchaeota archaeon]